MGNETLAVFHTAGKDDSAYWNTYDWDKALAWGMKTQGLEYSGQMRFIETEMSWPITHMVAPKGDALTCAQCHKENGRLQQITGAYMPGRNNTPNVDIIGFTIALMALIGVLFHGAIRFFMRKKD
jgi:hypothetical protein